MIFFKFVFISIIGGIFAMNLQAAETKKYGYVPLTFPRDPAEVSFFPEQVMLGQILEPLVDTDKMGNLTPGVAESWAFENQGLTIRIKLNKSRRFSNGNLISSKDVKYTINRMIEKKSQSAQFLNSISEITTLTEGEVIIKLKEPNVALLKALSRDQLGIVPDGWSFDKNSKEPFVGSGPYRLVKENEKWYLIENGKYQGSLKPIIKKWELVYLSDSKGNIPDNNIPDYAPAISYSTKDSLMKLSGAEKFKSMEQLSFSQSSAWWHPSGSHFKSEESRKKAMQVIEKIMALTSKKLNQERATGIIPKGVAGHLAEYKGNDVKTNGKSSSLNKLRIGYKGSLFDEIIESGEVKDIAKKAGLDLEFIRIDNSNQASANIDIIFAAWAGGFNDPEGFIGLLQTNLGQDFISYAGTKIAELYKKARAEQNWADRSALFQKINKELRDSSLMVPGWKISYFVVGQPSLLSEESTYRYTPRFQLVKDNSSR